MERDEIARELVLVAVSGFALAEEAAGPNTANYAFAMGQVEAVKKIAVALGISLRVYMDVQYAAAWDNLTKGKEA